MDYYTFQKIVIVIAFALALVGFKWWLTRYRRKHRSAQKAFDAVTWVVIVIAGLGVLAVIVYAFFDPP